MRTSTERFPPIRPSSDGRAPDFFIVGQFKSGTTALYEMLRRHPQVFMPVLKEIWFLAPELWSGSRMGGRPETIEGYLALFADAQRDQRIGEATPSYLMSEGAARRIAELQPNARIIAILREPASFLRSFHLQCVQNRTETENDLRKALEMEGERREGRNIPRYAPRPHELMYSDHVRYVEQLRRYYDVFSPEQILVLIYEDFRRDNAAVLGEVLRFLDVDDSHPLEPIEANPSVRVRHPRLHEALLSTYLGRGRVAGAVKQLGKLVVPKRLRGRAFKAAQRHVIFGEPRPVDDSVMLELRRRFKGEVVALSEYLGRDLVTLWGYDEIA